jgi:hypothetical protein
MVAWSLWLAAMILTAAGAWLLFLTRDLSLPDSWGVRGYPAVFAVTFATVGAVVLARRPGNAVGWLFSAAGILSGAQLFTSQYAIYGLLAAPGSIPGAIWAAWFVSWMWIWALVIAGPLLLTLFPDGRPVSGRWRRLIWLALASGLIGSLGFAFQQGPLDNYSFATNPLGLGTGFAILRVGIAGVVVTIVLAAASLAVRYRRSEADERQQLKWVALAAIAVALVAPTSLTGHKLAQVALIVALCGIPIAAGVAVLRYRLYDIDTVINRALVYGLLTAILAGVSAATIALIERLFQGLAGQGSDLAIILSTLIVVTGFTPVKERLQRLVDRHFKEARDPTIALQAFVTEVANRLGPLDPDRVLGRLLAVSAEATNATAGAVESGAAGASRGIATVGSWTGRPALEMSDSLGGISTSLTLGARRDARPYAPRDHVAIEKALHAVLAEIEAQNPSRAGDPAN